MSSVRQFRESSVEDLKAKIESLQESLFKLKCNHVLGQVPDTSVIRKHRRDIARAKTVLTEKMN